MYPFAPKLHLESPRYYIIKCVIVVLEILMVYFTYPETESIILEEIIIVFDGERAAQNTGFKGDTAEATATHVENKDGSVVNRRELS